jgi:hypothetical protein
MTSRLRAALIVAMVAAFMDFAWDRMVFLT